MPFMNHNLFCGYIYLYANDGKFKGYTDIMTSIIIIELIRREGEFQHQFEYIQLNADIFCTCFLFEYDEKIHIHNKF